MRHRRSRLVGVLAAASVLSLAVAACGSSGSNASGGSSGRTASAPGVTADSITLGTDMPLTGPVASAGLEGVAAYQAYVKYVNAHGGINGRKLILKVGDSAYDPATALSAVRTLVQGNVFAIFDNFGTPPAQGTYNFLNQQQIPDVNIYAGDTQFVQPIQKYTFELLPQYASDAAFVVSYIKKNWPGKRVAILYQNDGFGQPYYNTFKKLLGSSLVSASYDPTSTSVLSQVTTLASSHAPVAFCACITQPAAQFLEDAHNLGWHMQPFLTFGVLDSTTEGLTGKALIDNALGSDFIPPTDDTSNPQVALMKSILTKYAPSASFDFQSFSALVSIDLMVQMLKSAGQNPTREGLLTAMTSHSYKGPWPGQVHLTSTNHNALSCEQMNKMVNGDVITVGSVSCS